ncbi:metal-dependent hydrolase [Citreimonas salinaria]|nr:metal-dependent hydrolase [Citreimonas salinaria]
MWKAHLALGALAGVVLSAFGPSQAPVIITAALLGSLLPDLDHPHSKLGRKVRPLSDLVYAVMGHRTGTHSVLFLVCVSALVGFVHMPAGAGLALGIASHLLADAVSYSTGRPFTTGGAGVPAAWPVSNSRVGVRIVRVNGFFEHFVVTTGAAMLAFAVAALTL